MAPFQSTPDNGQIQAAVSDRVTGEGFRALLTPPDVLLATAPPDFSVLAPSYASAQEVSVIDITPDSHIFYTTDGTDPTADSKPYRKSMVIDKTTTIKAIAIGGTGYAASVISNAPYTIAVPEYPLPSIDLTANDDTCPFGSMFRSPRLGGINGLCKAIAADVLGSSLNWGSSEFLFGVPDTSNGTANATIHFVPGYYRTVNVLATGLRDDHPNEKFTVTYSDGSSETTSIAMSDWATPLHHAGEAIALTMTHGITSTGMLAYGPYYLYGYSLAVLPTKKLSSLATPNDRNIVVLGVAPANPPGADRPLMLSDSFSVIGIAAGNEAVERLGRDGFYNTYSAELLGISVSWSGSLFQIGSSGGPRAVSNATIETPYGQYATLNLLGISVRGDHPLQHFVVNYTDATSQTFEQSISDWHSAQNYAGEAIAALMAYRVASSGVHQPGPFDLYGYAFSLDKSKTIW